MARKLRDYLRIPEITWRAQDASAPSYRGGSSTYRAGRSLSDIPSPTVSRHIVLFVVLFSVSFIVSRYCVWYCFATVSIISLTRYRLSLYLCCKFGHFVSALPPYLCYNAYHFVNAFHLCVKVEHLIIALRSLYCCALVYRFVLRYCAYGIVRRRYRVPLMLYDLGITVFRGYNCEIASYRVVRRIVARFVIICYPMLLSYSNIHIFYY